MNNSLWAILALILITVLFWQHRKQVEYAKRLIEQRCRHLELQLLSISYMGFKLTKNGLNWRYQFEFASVANSAYAGNLILKGKQYTFDIPAYKEELNS